MNINCTKYSYRTFTILLLPLLYLLSNFLPEGLFGKNREYQFIEIFQIIVLLSCLVLNFSYRTLFFKVSNFFTFLIRQLLILVLLYEELSFLTFSTNNTFNFQNEFNFHNSTIAAIEVFSFTIPQTNITFSPSFETCLYITIFFILGYGSYFPCMKKVRYIFFERQYAIYTFLYLSTIVCNKFSYLNPIEGKVLIRGEILELSVYIFLLLDTIQKIRIIKNFNQKMVF